MVSNTANEQLLKELMGSSPSYPPSLLPLLDPVRSWEWPVKVSANFQRRLSFHQQRSCTTRRVQTDDGTFWLMALRNHAFPTALPPHPGNPPSELNTMTIGGYGFMDGSIGRFDFRRYPQVFRPDSPWRAFILTPNCDEVTSRPEYDCPLRHWREQERKWEWGWIKRLFQRKFRVAANLSTFLRSHYKAFDYLQSKNYSFPSFDETVEEDFLDEVDLSNSVQLIGYTQRWIAELEAILFWLVDLRPWEGNFPPITPQQVHLRFQGCWLRSDISPDDEKLLAAAKVPIFIALRVRETEYFELRSDDLDFSNGECSRPYLTNWFLGLQRRAPVPDPQQTPFPRNLHWEQPTIGTILPTLPVLVDTQGYFPKHLLRPEHIAHNPNYSSMLGPWGCPLWKEDKRSFQFGEYNMCDPFDIIEVDTGPRPLEPIHAPLAIGDPAAPITSTNPPEQTPTVSNSPHQQMDIGDPAAPMTPTNRPEPTPTVPDSSHQQMDIGDPAAPMTSTNPPEPTPTVPDFPHQQMATGDASSQSLIRRRSPQQNSGPLPRSEEASTYGVSLTDGLGRPRNPAIINGRSELQAFGFPLTGPHPVFREKPAAGSHWYRYESILGGGSVDYITRPRSLDFSRFDCSHLFVWPNPLGGGFIFLLTDTPIASKPDFGRLESSSEDEDEDEDEYPPPPAAGPSAPQNAEPLTPPSTPPPTEDVRMHSPPSEDVRMQSPPFARPGEPGTPPGTPPSRRLQSSVVRTPCSRSRSPRRDRSTSPPYRTTPAERVGQPPSTYGGGTFRGPYFRGQTGLGSFDGQSRRREHSSRPRANSRPSRGRPGRGLFNSASTPASRPARGWGLSESRAPGWGVPNGAPRQFSHTTPRWGPSESRAPGWGPSESGAPSWGLSESGAPGWGLSESRPLGWGPPEGAPRQVSHTTPGWGLPDGGASGWGPPDRVSRQVSPTAPSWGTPDGGGLGWGAPATTVSRMAPGLGPPGRSSTQVSRTSPGWGPWDDVSNPVSRAAPGWGPPNTTSTQVSRTSPGWVPPDNVSTRVLHTLPGANAETLNPVSSSPKALASPSSPSLPTLNSSNASDQNVAATNKTRQPPPVPLSLAQRIHGADPSRSNPRHIAEVPKHPSLLEVEKSLLFEKLEANNNWVQRDKAIQDPVVKSTAKREKTSQKRLELHFNVWYKNLKNYFEVPPVPQTLRTRTEYQGARTVGSMYQEAYAWADAMIQEIEATRARGDQPIFTDAEFDSLIASLGWEALLRRVDPELRASINPVQPSASASSAVDAHDNNAAHDQPEDEGDLFD